MTMPIYFFGCWGSLGHRVHAPGNGYVSMATRATLPVTETALDAKFAPKDPRQTEGRATVTHLRGWTIVAWWDRAGDSRPNSNSAFLMKGEHTLTAVLLEAGEQYPELLPRFATLVEVKT